MTGWRHSWRPCRILPAAFCGNDTVRGDNTFIAGRQQPWDKWYPTQKTGPNPHRPQRKAVMTQPRPTTLSWPSEHPRNPLPCGKSDSHGAKWLQEKGCCRVTQAGSLCKEFSRIVWTAAHPLPFLSLSSSSVSFCVSYTHTHTHTHPNTNDAALGASLVVQWLRLHASTPGTPRSIPGQGTKISHTTQQDQKKKKAYVQMMQSFHLPNPVPQSFVYTGITHWTSSFWLKTLNSAQVIVLHTRKAFEGPRRSSSLFPGSLKSWFKKKKKKDFWLAWSEQNIFCHIFL